MECKLQQYYRHIYTYEHLSRRELEYSTVSISNAISKRGIRIELDFLRKRESAFEAQLVAGWEAMRCRFLPECGMRKLASQHDQRAIKHLFRHDSCDVPLSLAVISFR